ncbi:unnamed protein product, partial [Staurois parvus]
RYSCRRCVRTGPATRLYCAEEPAPTCSSVQQCPTFTGCLLSLTPASSVWASGCDSLRLHSQVPTAHVCSLWSSSPVVRPQSLVIPCTVSAVSGHLLYCVRSLWSSPVVRPQSLVIS